MDLVELTAYHVRIPLRKRIRHALHTRTSTDNLVVRCVLADGTVGNGEGVPRDYVTGETIDSAFALLRRSDLRSQFELCRDFERAVNMAERLQLAPVPGDERRCQGNAARCAVELAILDAYGRHFGEPLSAATKLLTPELHEPKRRVRYSGMVTSAKGFKLRLAAFALWVYGFRQIKVKVGIPGYDDFRRLRVLRRMLGSKREFRVDANEAWSAAEAVTRIRSLEPFGLRSVEQPVPHAEVESLGQIRREVDVPIMLDESLCSMVDAERTVEGGLADLFNLRLSKCGGFIPTLRLAQFACRHHLGYQLGCQVGETALLSAAGRHFACSVAGLRCLEGSYDRHLVREALATQDQTFGWGGWAKALQKPGLGVSVDEAALERVTVCKETLLG